LEERTVEFGPTVVRDLGPALIDVAKMVGVSTDFELLARCEDDVRGALAGQVFIARSQPYYLDITHPLANKGVELTELANLLGIPSTQIAYWRRGHDVPMFERSRLSIAMGNASPCVQRAADLGYRHWRLSLDPLRSILPSRKA
jgi:hydroxymethylpyrimidine pyrophosphatase-like HAD family hydrolase